MSHTDNKAKSNIYFDMVIKSVPFQVGLDSSFRNFSTVLKSENSTKTEPCTYVIIHSVPNRINLNLEFFILVSAHANRIYATKFVEIFLKLGLQGGSFFFSEPFLRRRAMRLTR